VGNQVLPRSELLSYRALGFKVLYDTIGFSKLVEEMLKSLSTTDYRCFKEGRWIDLSIVVRIKMKLAFFE